MAMQFATKAADAETFDSDADCADFISKHFANTMATISKASAAFQVEARKAAEAHITHKRLRLHGAEREKYIAEYVRDYNAGAEKVRTRIRAILDSPEAEHRKEAAINIAMTGLNVEQARRVLASLPERREAPYLRLAFGAGDEREDKGAKAKVENVLRAAGVVRPDGPDAA